MSYKLFAVTAAIFFCYQAIEALEYSLEPEDALNDIVNRRMMIRKIIMAQDSKRSRIGRAFYGNRLKTSDDSYTKRFYKRQKEPQESMCCSPNTAGQSASIYPNSGTTEPPIVVPKPKRIEFASSDPEYNWSYDEKK